MTDFETDYVYGSFLLMTVFAVVSFLLFLVSLVLCWLKYRNSLLEEKRLSFIEGYAKSMVHTYFYDSLKKLIPDKGTGLYDKIMLYKDIENLEDEDFRLHKIFIIICASGLIPTSLRDIDNIRIESRKLLNLHCDGSVTTSTNGSKLTNSPLDVYMSISVYKVKHRNLKDHITVATGPPLLTLHEASKEDPELEDNKKQIIEVFYKKLSKKLSESVEFQNSYELLFYNDDPEKAPTLAEEIFLRHVDQGLMREDTMAYPFNTDSVNETSKLH